jgi:hypothetical protein
VTTTTLIPGLPAQLGAIPNDPTRWKMWRDRVLRVRVELRRNAEADPEARAKLLAGIADPLYFMTLFGVHFEPRDRPGRPKGWYPSVPMPFQGRLVRWIEAVLAIMPESEEGLKGRADGVLEKARGMTGTYTFLQFITARWLADEGASFGVASYKGDAVDKTNAPGTLFYKIRANLGLIEAVPSQRFLTLADGSEILCPLKAPEWLLPPGFKKRRHSTEMALQNPDKSNYISGYTSTGKTTTGDRLTLMFSDEASKWFEFHYAWENQSAVTDHRLAISSADLRYGASFRDLAQSGANAHKNPELPGPSYLRLEWGEHPEQDALWRQAMTARHVDNPAALAREYDLDYDAGHATKIYAEKAERTPIKHLEFRPAEQSLDWCVDPGVANATAMHLVTYDAGLDQYGLFDSYANSGKPAEFYATILLGTPLYVAYDYTDDDEDVMRTYRQYGDRIRYFVGDPAGNQRSSVTATSFYDELRASIARLSDGRRSIAVSTKYDENARAIGVRIEALRWMLGKLVVNDTVRTRRTLAALMEYAFPAPPEHRPALDREPQAPLRFWGHDLVTALEYLAVHRKLATASMFERLPPVRAGLSGKPIETPRRSGLWIPGTRS